MQPEGLAAEQRQQLLVGAPPARLNRGALPVQLRQLLAEVFERQQVHDRARRDVQRRRRPAAEREGFRIDPALAQSAQQRERDRRGQHTPQRLVAVILVNHRQRVALEQPQPLREGDPHVGAVQAMVGNRGRRQHGAVAAQRHAPPEIDVLEVGEEIEIEAAGLDVGVARNQHRSAAGEEQRPFLIVASADRRAEVALPGVPDEGHDARDEVDPLAVPVEDARGDALGLVPLRRRDQLGDPVRVDARVVVQQGDEMSVRPADHVVVRRREAEIAIEPVYLDPRELLAHEFDRSVRGPVVDHLDRKLILRIHLHRQRRQAGLKVIPSVVVQDQDGHTR
jgi:hypothetical protein